MSQVANWDAIRARLEATKGREFWRSLDELAEHPDFLEYLQHEFPRQAEGAAGGLDRRVFMKLMAASLGLAGLNACTRQPDEKIVPYVKQPEQLVLGEALQFATAMTFDGGAIGLLVESHEGRPTKIEGNPLHPASQGGTDAITQAAILTLYDPDRSQVVSSAGTIRPWAAFRTVVQDMLAAQQPRQGAGLRFLTETVTSPTLAAQLEGLLAELPAAQWHQWEPSARDGAVAGAQRAFGEIVDTHYRLKDADLIVSLDADFLTTGPQHLRLTREFARRRRPEGGPMNRLYAIESTPSLTGGKADHRLAVRASEVESVARALANALAVKAAPGDHAIAQAHQAWVTKLAADLQAHRGRSAIIAGDGQPAAVHALAHALNAALGNVGQTVVHTDPIAFRATETSTSLRALVDDMHAGKVECLVVLGANPVHTAPADLDFTTALSTVGLRIHHGLFHDETAEQSHWHVPATHFLEAWSDTRAYDGTVSIVQPLIAPLYDGRSEHEFLAAFTKNPDRSGFELVRAVWKAVHAGVDFETFWQRSLHDGIVAGIGFSPKHLALSGDWDRDRSAAAAQGMEIIFRLDPHVHDGRFANNGWLQELPRPMSKLVWDNAALLAPATATQLGVAQGDVVEIERAGQRVKVPVWLSPGHPANAVTLTLGYGRQRAGRVGSGVGVDVNPLRTSTAPHFVLGATLRPTGERATLATTQDHHAMEGRAPVRIASLAEFTKHPEFAREVEEQPGKDDTLYPPHAYTGHAWGMTIDLGACIGCNACTIACQAENNIAVVGKEMVLRGREMHWIRVDRYYTGNIDTPDTVHQPVPCMHCEDAPCEMVCPVNATVHSSEGLNDMVYNRCVGTRYCSNNCPYKVRRYNFFLYSDWKTKPLMLARNPDVTVRSRGVMEKCSYCVQRIERARVTAHQDNRAIRDGEIVTACQQACPAEAIVFGDINDPQSHVAKVKNDPRNYLLLASLNTRPRTSYLATIRNPNPVIDDDGSLDAPPGGHHS